MFRHQETFLQFFQNHHFRVFCRWFYLKGHVGDVDQLVVCEGEQVEEAELRERPGLDLFHTITIEHELLQRGQSIEGLLDRGGQSLV